MDLPEPWTPWVPVAAEVRPADPPDPPVDALRKRVAHLDGSVAMPGAASPGRVGPAGMSGHTHTCRNGHTWDHSQDGGSHRCPTCGESQNVVDQPGRETAPPVRYSTGSGCPTGGCPAVSAGSYRTLGSASGCGPGGCPAPSAARGGLFRRW
ncbi:MAG: hypothetical protein K2X82_08465 [Gemmataceae bacterium]|nr:hypothetical protein [Gemmataceae bacterium]